MPSQQRVTDAVRTGLRSLLPFDYWRRLPLKPKIKRTFLMLGVLFVGSSFAPPALHVAIDAMGVLACVALGTALYRSVILPLDRTLADLGRFGVGDLRLGAEANHPYRLALLERSIANCRENVRSVVAQISAAATVVEQGTGQMAADNGDLRTRTDQQAAALADASGTVDILADIVRVNAASAAAAKALAADARARASAGSAVVEQVVATMLNIGESTREIASIVGVIDDIAFQTNILALNAAVEAAHAGKHGQGFAVIASAVRELAQCSADAASQAKRKIHAAGTSIAASGTLVAEAGKSMERIRASADGVADAVGEIAATSTAKSAKIKAVRHTVDQLNAVTRSNAALVNGVASSAGAMAEQARKLSSLVQTFRL